MNSTALIVYWHGAVHSSHYLPIARLYMYIEWVLYMVER